MSGDTKENMCSLRSSQVQADVTLYHVAIRFITLSSRRQSRAAGLQRMTNVTLFDHKRNSLVFHYYYSYSMRKNFEKICQLQLRRRNFKRKLIAFKSYFFNIFLTSQYKTCHTLYDPPRTSARLPLYRQDDKL